MATYAIGDTQGCFNELQLLLEKIHFNPQEDRLWFVGDLVNRGPASLDLLRFIKALPKKPIIVLGNHDLHLLAVASGKASLKKQDTIQPILAASDGEELCYWLRQQSLLHHDTELGYTLVHAGLAPQWDLTLALALAKEVETLLHGNDYAEFFAHMYGNEPNMWDEKLTGFARWRFIVNCLTRIRFCDMQGKIDLTLKGKLGTQPVGYLPWFAVPHRASRNLNIVFGHWAALDAIGDVSGIYHLDSGCVWGNSLTAMRLEDKQRLSVPCLTYCQQGKAE